MARVNLTKALSTEYQELFQTLEMDPGWFADVDRIVDRILQHRDKYEAVGERVNAPWFFIGAIHNATARTWRFLTLTHLNLQLCWSSP